MYRYFCPILIKNVTIFLSDFNQKWILSTHYHENPPQHKISVKLSSGNRDDTRGQTDEHDNGDRRFPQLRLQVGMVAKLLPLTPN